MKDKIEQTKKLALMLGIGGLTGPIAIAALAGLFKPENAAFLAVSFMAGPGSILSATLLDGNAKERILSAVLAGAIATLIVVLAAWFGPKLLGFLNLNILKIAGAVAICSIALLVAGVNIPNNLPIWIIIAGMILAGFWRN